MDIGNLSKKVDVERVYNPLTVIVFIIRLLLPMVDVFFLGIVFINNIAFVSASISVFVIYIIIILAKQQKE